MLWFSDLDCCGNEVMDDGASTTVSSMPKRIAVKLHNVSITKDALINSVYL